MKMVWWWMNEDSVVVDEKGLVDEGGVVVKVVWWLRWCNPSYPPHFIGHLIHTKVLTHSGPK